MKTPLLGISTGIAAGELDSTALAALRSEPDAARAQLIEVMKEIARLGPAVLENDILLCQALVIIPLLAEFGDEDCYAHLSVLLHFPFEVVDGLFGQTGISLVGMAFARCTLRNPGRLVEMVSDGATPSPLRLSALETLCHHTAYGRIPVADASLAARAYIGHLSQVVQGSDPSAAATAREELEVACECVSEVLPHSLRSVLEGVIQAEVCDSRFFGGKDLAARLRGSEAESMAAYRQDNPDSCSTEEALNMLLGEIEEADRNSAKFHEPVRKLVRVGRNDPCPCGSGKKFKKCCDA